MFDLSMSEMLVVVVVTLVAIGPKDLPRALHTVGRWVSKARAMASEFHRHIDEMVHEVELEEFHRKAADLNRKTLTQVLENVVDIDGKMRNHLELQVKQEGKIIPISDTSDTIPTPDTKPSNGSNTTGVPKESAEVPRKSLTKPSSFSPPL